MDQGDGTFKGFRNLLEAQEAQSSNPLAGGIFQKGETVEIRGSHFKISQVLHKGLKLKLLSKEEVSGNA